MLAPNGSNTCTEAPRVAAFVLETVSSWGTYKYVPFAMGAAVQRVLVIYKTTESR